MQIERRLWATLYLHRVVWLGGWEHEPATSSTKAGQHHFKCVHKIKVDSQVRGELKEHFLGQMSLLFYEHTTGKLVHISKGLNTPVSRVHTTLITL